MSQAVNFEIKARIKDAKNIRTILNDFGADFKGKDHQLDIYFKVPQGRLKLRKGTIENALIYYKRENLKTQKESQVLFEKIEENNKLDSVLESALGILTAVDKTREIYFVENVKFHIDEVKDLGSFMEIEAISENGEFSKEYLSSQCVYYMQALGINKSDLIDVSYSDLLLQNQIS